LPSLGSATTIFSRPLPDSTNVNNGAGANRSNVTWANQVSGGTVFLVGDEFDLSLTPNPFGAWRIDSISVWEVANTGISSATSISPPVGSAPQTEFSSLTLFGGDAFGTLTPLSSTYTSQFVQYAPTGLNYQGSAGGFFPIYEITFSNLNLVVPATADIGFAVNAVPNGNNIFFIHASNAPLSGTPQIGADGFFENYCTDTPTPVGATTASYCALIDSNGNGWDKSNDINVLVTGSAVPEPATFGLIGAGLAGIVLLRKRVKQAIS
jgi:hypothetical protein